MELELGPVSLREVLESGVTMHAERAARERISLELDAGADDVTLLADERKLRQVVFNLLSNAAKFTPPGGRIDVSMAVAGSEAQVAVSDTGPGIPDSDHELIFEEFQQGRGGRLATQQGTGLGLPLSRRFIELHRGRLWVESVEGRGSTFRFTLPLEKVG
jgi:signal transduction histidine kinase